MPVPKRKTGKTRKRMRRAHDFLTMPSRAVCENCGEQTLPHHVCGHCGYYGKRTVVNVDED